MFLDQDQEKRFVELPCYQAIHKSLAQDKELGKRTFRLRSRAPDLLDLKFQHKLDSPNSPQWLKEWIAPRIREITIH